MDVVKVNSQAGVIMGCHSTYYKDASGNMCKDIRSRCATEPTHQAAQRSTQLAVQQNRSGVVKVFAIKAAI
jgi:hypothetical protein